jgi:hypothetical protein
MFELVRLEQVPTVAINVYTPLTPGWALAKVRLFEVLVKLFGPIQK